MAKQDALSIFLSDGTTEDKLRESYAALVDMIQKGAISSQIKNVNLSGDPESGSVIVQRLITSASAAYGTARTASEGSKVKNNPVTINLDQDKEIVEEVEWKDIQYWGVGDILSKRSVNHRLALIRELDTAFFAEAESEGSEETITSTDIEDQVEDLIQSVETTANNHVDGVDRDLLVLTLKPSVYGELRNYIDTLPNPVDGGVDVKKFHDVRVLSNTRQTEDAICMVVGSVAQPVVAKPYQVERIPLSNAVAIELFYHYGTKAVMSDLIKYASFSSVSA